ncbi:hypothetical protein SDC9_97289 [bioreactor metagenome]|uniref:Uncharacterized protein n=1 Tax=bioreactor metagenome TaxID=1076179 RepID=A0A645ABZ1_9ZZZZ
MKIGGILITFLMRNNLIFIFLASILICVLLFLYKKFKTNNNNRKTYYFLFAFLGIVLFWILFLFVFINLRVSMYHAEYFDSGLVYACLSSAVSAVVVIMVFLINYYRK